jgi:glycosyltransferase involved in cell wall biosynthesis
MLTDGIEGFITSDDPEEVAERTIALLSNPDLRLSMGKNARQNVLERFGIERNTDVVEQLFLSVAVGQAKFLIHD